MSIGKPDLPASTDAQRQRTLVFALRDALARRDDAAPPELLETHISYVLLTGRYAYKIKKSVELGFLDFGTLERRRRCCADEVRLNRRLAAALYLGVVAIRGTPQAPRLDASDAERAADDAPAIEYAVKMVEFAQEALFDRMLARGQLHGDRLDALAERVAAFHLQAACQPPAAEFGSPAQIWRLAAENLAALSVTDELASWSRAQYQRLAPLFAERRSAGFVRECHGDLHLANIALHDDAPQPFDCIEFSAELRWIDVINEVAFLVMDLEERGRSDLAWRFVNRYCAATGDYAGLACLPFYRVYRALVRAKVAALRAAQEAEPQARRELATRDQYLDFARRAIAPRAPAMVLMHGFSGSGKSWTAQALQEALPAVCLRSDVERKRLHGLPARARSASALNAGLYDPDSTAATYRRLAALARPLLAAGLVVVVDAACLASWQRQIFRALADELALPLRIVSCRAAEATLRRRLQARAQADDDASEADPAILAAQLRNNDPLDAEERAHTLVCEEGGLSTAALVHRLAASLARA